MAISVEPMAERHIDGFHRVFDAVARERKFLAHLEAPPLEQVRHLALGSLAKGGNVHLMALDGSDIVGWCDITRIERAAFAHCGGLGMGLLPAYRGRGIGKSLLSAALAAAWAQGMTRVELTVYASNTGAIALYEKRGFVKEGCLRKRALIDGAYVDTWFMAVLRDDLAVLAESGQPAQLKSVS